MGAEEMIEDELQVGSDLARVGVRQAGPCGCVDPECPRKQMAVEVATIAGPQISMDIAKQYVEHGEGHPIAFPVFITADEARLLAEKLLQLADAADPRTKH